MRGAFQNLSELFGTFRNLSEPLGSTRSLLAQGVAFKIGASKRVGELPGTAQSAVAGSELSV